MGDNAELSASRAARSRHAYVTLVTNGDYVKGAVALLRSLVLLVCLSCAAAFQAAPLLPARAAVTSSAAASIQVGPRLPAHREHIGQSGCTPPQPRPPRRRRP